jgi:hypothetical protein
VCVVEVLIYRIFWGSEERWNEHTRILLAEGTRNDVPEETGFEDIFLWYQVEGINVGSYPI